MTVIFQAYAGDLICGRFTGPCRTGRAALEKPGEKCNALSNHIMDSEIFQPDDLAAIARCVWRKTSLSRDGSSILAIQKAIFLNFGIPPAAIRTSPSHEWKHCPYCGFSIWSDYPSESWGTVR